MKNNVKVIHFHTKLEVRKTLFSRKFKDRTTDFYFENNKVGIKTAIANL